MHKSGIVVQVPREWWNVMNRQQYVLTTTILTANSDLSVLALDAEENSLCLSHYSLSYFSMNILKLRNVFNLPVEYPITKHDCLRIQQNDLNTNAF